jgi:CRISPR system Cascade subunit CasD
MANTLFLRLEGPLQAWGERARWSVRDTAPEPTKSGVIGLLGCALGVRSDADLQDLSVRLRVGVRCDRPGVPLVDFHTVVGGVLSAEGKIKKTASTGEYETLLSHRHYLCDASFLVALQGDAVLIARLADAVQRPRWPIFLGRRCCVPSRPVFEGVGDYPSLEAALEAAPGGPDCVRGVIECAANEGGVRRRDEVLSRTWRTFATRYTRDVMIRRPAVGREDDPCTSPD